MTKFSMRLNETLLHILCCKYDSGSCDLCLTEKLNIMREDCELLLNKQLELASKCHYKNKFILASIKKLFSYDMYCIGNHMYIE